MSMTKAEFITALREAVSSEFAHIPCNENEIDIILSDRFKRKMEKLIKAQRKPYYALINTAAKRVAIIIVAIITLFTASLSVEAIRTPVINFVTQIYETFVEYFFEGDTAKKIEKEYVITNLPDGYELKEKIESEASITYVYLNNSNEYLWFSQKITSEAKSIFDNEKSNIYNYKIDNLEVSICKTNTKRYAFWTKENYYLTISASSNVSNETIINMIKSVKLSGNEH